MEKILVYSNVFKLVLYKFLLLQGAVIFAQKAFTIELKISPDIDTTFLDVTFDDGLDEFDLPLQESDRKAIYVLKGSYFSTFPVIQLSYSKEGSDYFNSFFIEDTNAVQSLSVSINKQGKVFLDKTSGVKDIFEMGQEKMDKYIENENQKLFAFLNEHMDFYIKDSLIQIVEALNLEREQKTLAYVRENPDFFSLWFFNKFLVHSRIPLATVESAFYEVFNDEQKNSFEGKEIQKKINGNKLSMLHKAPNFEVKSISGRMLSLREIIKEKYVLLVFWATWCSPCVEEIPALREVHNSYGDKLEMISISLDSDYEKLKKGIEKYELVWENVNDQSEITHQYGVTAIPRLFLINRAGELIYFGESDKNLTELKSLLAEEL